MQLHSGAAPSRICAIPTLTLVLRLVGRHVAAAQQGCHQAAQACGTSGSQVQRSVRSRWERAPERWEVRSGQPLLAGPAIDICRAARWRAVPDTAPANSAHQCPAWWAGGRMHLRGAGGRRSARRRLINASAGGPNRAEQALRLRPQRAAAREWLGMLGHQRDPACSRRLPQGLLPTTHPSPCPASLAGRGLCRPLTWEGFNCSRSRPARGREARAGPHPKSRGVGRAGSRARQGRGASIGHWRDAQRWNCQAAIVRKHAGARRAAAAWGPATTPVRGDGGRQQQRHGHHDGLQPKARHAEGCQGPGALSGGRGVPSWASRRVAGLALSRCGSICEFLAV